MDSEKNEPLGLVVDKLKGFAKSTQDFTNGVLHSIGLARRRHPIEILKRLQREAFSDIMKLRDRQDKMERLLSLKSTKLSPLNDSTTRIRGEIQALGLLLMTFNTIQEHHQEAIHQTGIKPSINSKFTFETTIRETDTLKAEFTTSDQGQNGHFTSPLSLGKVVLESKINKWCSLTSLLLGAKCCDLEKHGVIINGPPLLNQEIGSGVSVTLKNPNFIGSLAHFGNTHFLSTFGQVVCRVSGSTKVLLLGLHQVPKILGQDGFLGNLRRTALAFESELDSSTRVGGWVEMSNKADTDAPFKWGVSVSDLPDDDFGWGLRVGGSVWDRCEVEAFSKVKLGEKFLLEPSLLYVINGSSRFPALMLKSGWSF